VAGERFQTVGIEHRREASTPPQMFLESLPNHVDAAFVVVAHLDLGPD
jgi:hypothetical protein